MSPARDPRPPGAAGRPEPEPPAADLTCPRCRHPLPPFPVPPEAPARGTTWACDSCGEGGPVVLGIPDLRLRPDPWIGSEADRHKGLALVEGEQAARTGSGSAHRASARELVERYWSLTPETPSELARRFTAHALAGLERGRHLLADVDVEKRPRVLELGCRAGGVLASAAELGAQVTGIDVAFRWLVVAGRLLEERGLAGRLACCNAEHLPFADGSFDLVLAENVLEHAERPVELLDEAFRVLAPGGLFLALTWNRLAPAPEPHVRLWGVGWLPRAWREPYVRWRGRGPYRHVRLLSRFELARALRRSAFGGGRITAAALPEVQLRELPAWQRRAMEAVARWRGAPLLGGLLSAAAPVLEVRAVRRASVS